MITTKITKVDSQFENIYRITTENGLSLDILEEKAPEVGDNFIYSLRHEKISGEITTMNGTIFCIKDDNIYVSFGGLLGYIPNDSEEYKLDDGITLIYQPIKNISNQHNEAQDQLKIT